MVTFKKIIFTISSDALTRDLSVTKFDLVQRWALRDGWCLIFLKERPSGRRMMLRNKLGFLVDAHFGGRRKGRRMMFRTMLVEDSSSFRQIVKANLHDQFPSMDIIEAVDGPEAFRKINSQPPNLIFMDINLPGENGLELTRKIKEDYPGVTVIILTSHDSPEYREAAIRSRANYFLSKGSIATDEIFKLVKSIILRKGFNADGSDN